MIPSASVSVEEEIEKPPLTEKEREKEKKLLAEMWMYQNYISTRREQEKELENQAPGRWRNPFKESLKDVVGVREMYEAEYKKRRQKYEKLQEKKPKEPKQARGRRKGIREKLLFALDNRSPKADCKVQNWFLENDKEEFCSLHSELSKGSSKKDKKEEKRSSREGSSKKDKKEEKRSSRGSGKKGKRENPIPSSSSSSSDDSSSSSDDSDSEKEDSDESSSGDEDPGRRKPDKSKKKKKKVKKRKKETDSDSDDSTESISTLKTCDSLDTTIIKVARFLKRLKAELRDGKIGVFELKECVEEIKNVIKTVNKMKKSHQISDLVDDLYRMKRKLCKQVDSEQKKLKIGRRCQN